MSTAESTLLQRRIRWGDELARVMLFACAVISVLTTFGIVYVLFSESLLFIQLRPGLEKAHQLVRDGGYVLITDLFRTTTERAKGFPP